MDAELKKRVSKLLKNYYTVFDVLSDYYRLNDPSRSVQSKFYLWGKKHALKMSDVTKIKNDPRHKGVLVLQPQEYKKVSLLNNRHEDIVRDNFYKYHGTEAVTGTGGDTWIKVTTDFADWLEQIIPKIEKATERANKAAGVTKPTQHKKAPSRATAGRKINQTITHKQNAPTLTNANALDTTERETILINRGAIYPSSKPIDELRKELGAIDFSAIAGEKLALWEHKIESDAGYTKIPMFVIDVPVNKRANAASVDPSGANTNKTIASLIEKTLTRTLRNDDSDDVFVFYQLVSGFLRDPSEDDAERGTYMFAMRMMLIDAFEKNHNIAVLPMLRIGKHSPHATSIRPLKVNKKIQVGYHQLHWTI
jgi:hypothetical protein